MTRQSKPPATKTEKVALGIPPRSWLRIMVHRLPVQCPPACFLASKTVARRGVLTHVAPSRGTRVGWGVARAAPAGSARPVAASSKPSGAGRDLGQRASQTRSSSGAVCLAAASAWLTVSIG